MLKKGLALALTVLAGTGAAWAAVTPRILTNHLGYEATAPKRAVVQGGPADAFGPFVLRVQPSDEVVFRGTAGAGAPVETWRDWRFWTLDFSELQAEGTYVIEVQGPRGPIRSFPFRLGRDLLERETLSDVLFYFKGQRCSGELDQADRHLSRPGAQGRTVDVHGGWYDASGDYGIHLSHLDFSTWFNPQQVPLVVFSLARTLELLEARRDGNFAQISRRLADELAYGADFLVRMRDPAGTFFQSIEAPGPGKKPEDRRLGRFMSSQFTVKVDRPVEGAPLPQADAGVADVSYRSGGGLAVAGLAMAARAARGGEFTRETYLKAAREAFAYLEAHNRELTNDGVENIVDDYCALLAASELFRTTGEAAYGAAARHRAESLMARSGEDCWRADGGDRPFFHASDAGAPVVALLDYLPLADPATQTRIRDTVRRALEGELKTTGEVANPFGLARQVVQTKDGGRRSTFFYPHDAETAPWWQGENARLAGLAAAARLAVPAFPADPVFQDRLRAYAADQLNWILGLNPFDASMLQGAGRNNPEYKFFSSWEYKSAPGGIVNGITSGWQDGTGMGIDLNVPYEVTHQDSDWRWAEQWLPHAAWYLLATAAGRTQAPAPKVVIGYIFCPDRRIEPSSVDPRKLTHINYAFANVQDGKMVEGFTFDTENFRALNEMKKVNPGLKVLVSVGGWGWSGHFSDVALTPASRKTFIDSAVAFLERHQLDGLDVDWEYPGQKGIGNTYRPEDRENCTALMAGLRAALDATGRHYLLSMATGADDAWLAHTEMDKLGGILDFVNLMAYDQAEPTSMTVDGHHAPLFTHPDDPRARSASSMVDHYLKAGVPPAKLVLGIPFYGHAWAGVPPAGFGLHQPGRNPDPEVEASFRTIRARLENKDGFTRHWDDVAKAPFLYSEGRRLFVSYEDEASAGLKTRYVMDKDLAGIMFWELWEDADGALLDAVNRGLGRSGTD